MGESASVLSVLVAPSRDRSVCGSCSRSRVLSPNSASCERVFALLQSMFGEEQMSVLADYVSAALMLRYNKRAVG